MDFSNISDNDQREYIRAKLELDDLERREVLPDDEYETAYKIARDGNSDEEIKLFNDTYVPNSYYVNQKKKLEEIINRINSQDERITHDLINNEKHDRAEIQRNYLRKIKAYYNNKNNETIRNTNIDDLSDAEVDRYRAVVSGEYDIMKNVNIDKLSDDAVIAMFRVIASGFDGEKLREIIDSDIKLEKDYEATNNRIRLFTKYYDRINSKINNLSASLVLDGSIKLANNSEIKAINDEFKKFDEYSKWVISEIDFLKKQDSNASFNMDSLEIIKKTNELKEKLRELKIKLKDKYNAMVEATNRKIYGLKSRTDLSEDIKDVVDNLFSINRYNSNITKWDQSLRLIDYKRLIDTDEIIKNIEDKLNEHKEEEKVNLDDDFQHIKNGLVNITLKLRGEVSDEQLPFIRKDIDTVKNNITEFRLKLESNKDKITKEEYDKYITSLDNFEKKAVELKEKTIKKDISEYDKLSLQLNDIETAVNGLTILIESLISKGEYGELSGYLKELEKCNDNLNSALDSINEKHNNKELDDIQYNNLIKQCDDLKDKYEDLKLKTKDIDSEKKESSKEEEIINSKEEEVVSTSSLDERIDNIEKKIDLFERKYNILSKPIKDDKNKEWLNKTIRQLQNEIQSIKNEIENDKENDNTERLDRLNNLEEKLKKIDSDYRKKTPLKVKNIKDATKDLYKKHPKVLLVVGGLASLAVIYKLIGPLVIPALIKGNLIMANKIPSAGIRNALFNINELLAKAIKATKVTHRVVMSNGTVASGLVYQLANGSKILVDSVTSSLLQGIAISAMSGSILSAPAIIAAIAGVKLLAKKLKKQEENENESKLKGDLVDKKRKNKELLNKWIFDNSYDFDTFCNDNEVSDEDREEFRNTLIEKGLLSNEVESKRGR